MAMYCTCNTCRAQGGQPHNIVPGDAEHIPGERVYMQEGWMLCHWSSRDFQMMQSREIHHFVRLEHKLRVGVSFYLYKGPVPIAQPQGLSMVGLGGRFRYTIGPHLGNRMKIYYKGNALANPREVAVCLGCGGSITFDDSSPKSATNFQDTDVRPVLTINR